MLNKKLALIATSVLAGTIFASSASALEVYPKGDTEKNTVFRYHRSDWVLTQSNASATLQWTCPSNAHAVGGGFESRAVGGNASNGLHMIHSFPKSNRTWEIRYKNVDDIARDIRIYVVCAD